MRASLQPARLPLQREKFAEQRLGSSVSGRRVVKCGSGKRAACEIVELRSALVAARDERRLHLFIFDQLGELLEKVFRIMWARRRLRMILDTENRQRFVTHSLDRIIV